MTGFEPWTSVNGSTALPTEPQPLLVILVTMPNSLVLANQCDQKKIAKCL